MRRPVKKNDFVKGDLRFDDKKVSKSPRRAGHSFDRAIHDGR